jgi:hypothetical protein
MIGPNICDEKLSSRKSRIRCITQTIGHLDSEVKSATESWLTAESSIFYKPTCNHNTN